MNRLEFFTKSGVNVQLPVSGTEVKQLLFQVSHPIINLDGSGGYVYVSIIDGIESKGDMRQYKKNSDVKFALSKQETIEIAKSTDKLIVIIKVKIVELLSSLNPDLSVDDIVTK